METNFKDLKINFLGDSITQGTGSSDREFCYVRRIAKETNAICNNYGIGGTRIARQHIPSEIAIHDRDFCSRIDEMNPDADIVAVFGGTNDYGHGDAPIGNFSDRTPDTFYGALHTLFASLINKYPTSFIFIITPLHRAGEKKKNINGLTLEEYVLAIKEVANSYRLSILDLYSLCPILPDDAENRMRFTTDGLHPNNAGHRLISKFIIDFLKENYWR